MPRHLNRKLEHVLVLNGTRAISIRPLALGRLGRLVEAGTTPASSAAWRPRAAPSGCPESAGAISRDTSPSGSAGGGVAPAAEEDSRDQRDGAHDPEDERQDGLEQVELVPPLLSSATIWVTLAGVAIRSASKATRDGAAVALVRRVVDCCSFTSTSAPVSGST